MDKSIRVLEDKERNINNLSTSGRDNTKEFVSDVIAHQGDLRFITMSAQKFVEESRVSSNNEHFIFLSFSRLKYKY